MAEWIRAHPAFVWSLVIASLVVFVASLVIVPALVVRIPADYFAHEHRPTGRWAVEHPVARLAVAIAKNTIGGIFMLAGLAMLVLPGQGILTLVIGFLVLDFPGKYGLEKGLLRWRLVLRPLNWLRGRRGREPLVVSGGRG